MTMKRSIQNDLLLENYYMDGMFAGTALTLMAQKHCLIFDSSKKKTFTSNLSLFKIALRHGLVGRSHAMQITDCVYIGHIRIGK